MKKYKLLPNYEAQPLPDMEEPKITNEKYKNVSKSFLGDMDIYEEAFSELPPVKVDKALWDSFGEGAVIEEGKDCKMGACTCTGVDCPDKPGKWFTPCKVLMPIAGKEEETFVWTDELVLEYAKYYRFSSSRTSIKQWREEIYSELPTHSRADGMGFGD